MEQAQVTGVLYLHYYYYYALFTDAHFFNMV
jgi:hypothetical protein